MLKYISLFFLQDTEKPKLHLNNMWLYRVIFTTCLSKHQREEGNFSVYLERCPSAKKLQAKAEQSTLPQGQPYLMQEVTCVWSDAGSFPFPHLQIKYKFILCGSFFFFFLIYLLILFIYLFLAALGLRCCTRAFSSCSERGLLFIAVHGLLTTVASRCRAQALGPRASVVVAHGLSSCGSRDLERRLSSCGTQA